MTTLVTGAIGIVAALIIAYLIRRDHLHVRYGLWWIVVAMAFVVLGVFPTLFDEFATFLGVAYGPVLALTLGLTVFVIKILTIDIARSRTETRMVRLVQRIAMLEEEVRQLQRDTHPDESGSESHAAGQVPTDND